MHEPEIEHPACSGIAVLCFHPSDTPASLGGRPFSHFSGHFIALPSRTAFILQGLPSAAPPALHPCLFSKSSQPSLFWTISISTEPSEPPRAVLPNVIQDIARGDFVRLTTAYDEWIEDGPGSHGSCRPNCPDNSPCVDNQGRDEQHADNGSQMSLDFECDSIKVDDDARGVMARYFKSEKFHPDCLVCIGQMTLGGLALS
ncbi:uncharacterized protein BJ171DRAFT_586670 [Polychytrium aggregatum]|uniref:uncharacterized protein n=1 Tax=Polychytrium aggregatum TaxID=110093 RepID=UPI0022FDF1CC|nr:uncharacterized protein BJ171DRAFT_586670 [Polychytrium aggregatum]KAI9193689.1 hypothetical protein BJ171DRAFT_586670 [Polychytrium aggregatum]